MVIHSTAVLIEFNNSLSVYVCFLDLCGTPGYLAPETLKCNMFDNAPGYSKEVDM